MTCFSGDEEKQVIWKNFFMVYGNLPLSYAEYFTFNVKFTHRQDPNPDPSPPQKKDSGGQDLVYKDSYRILLFCSISIALCTLLFTL